MNRVNILLCCAVAFSLVGGCTSNQYSLCVQEKEDLQKTVEGQQSQIDELKVKADATDAVIKKMSDQLQQCHRQRIKLLQKSAKTSSGNPRNPTSKQVSNKKSTGTRSKPSTTKKAGCPCRRKPSK